MARLFLKAWKGKGRFKYIFLSGILFEEMGLPIGPLDGHNINIVVNFKNADIEGPVLYISLLSRVKVINLREKHPGHHGVNPFIIGNGEQKKENKRAEYSQIFGGHVENCRRG